MGCGRGVVVVVDDDKVGDVDCAVVESFVSVFVPSSTETLLPLPLLLIVISVIAAAVAELAGQSSTYVVVVFSFAPSEAPPLLLLLGVINSRETAPCSSDTTRIVTVTTTLVDMLTGEEGGEGEGEKGDDDAKMSNVPAGVMAGTVDDDDVAVVELA